MLSKWIDIWLASGFRNIKIIPESVADPKTYTKDVPRGCPIDFVVYGEDYSGMTFIGCISEQVFYWSMPF